MSPLAVVIVLAIVLIATAYIARLNHQPAQKCTCDCKICVATPTALRLMMEHVLWTRQVIIATFRRTPDLPDALARLKQNQTDIAAAISAANEPAPGPVFKAQKELWDGHIDGAVAVVQAVIAGDTAAQQPATAAWYANGQAIADALAALRPAVWPRDQMRAMMKAHLDSLTAEVVAFAGQKWADDVRTQDAVTHHMVDFARVLAPGLVQK